MAEQPLFRICCEHGVPLSRLCLCCGDPSPDWMALVAAGVYDAEGFTPAERRASERKQAQPRGDVA